MTRPNGTWLLLHGTPLTPAVWADVARLLGGEATVVTPDLSHHRGQPGSQLGHARRVLDGLADGPLDVVGHSFGGQVALEVAIAATERVRSLTIVCSRDAPFPAFSAAAARLRETGEVDVDGTVGRWFTAAERDADGPVVRFARQCVARADPVAWADDLDAIATYDRVDAVSALDVPTTLVAAEQDQVATVDAMAALAGRLRHSTLHQVKGSHMSPFTDPAGLVELMSRPITT